MKGRDYCNVDIGAFVKWSKSLIRVEGYTQSRATDKANTGRVDFQLRPKFGFPFDESRSVIAKNVGSAVK